MAFAELSPIDLGGNKLTSVATPTAANDAAIKSYVDGLAAKWVPIAGRATVASENTGATNAGLQFVTAGRYGRTVHRVIAGGASQVRLEYANWGTQDGDATTSAGTTVSVGARPYEVSNPNSVSFRASIEYPAGVWKLVSGSTAYASGTTYAIGDQVISSSITYVCIQAGAGHTPASSPTFWLVVNRYLVHWNGEDGTRAVTCASGANIQSIPVAIPNLQPGMYVAVNSMVLTGSSSNKFTVGDISRSKDFAVDYATTPPTAGGSTDPVDVGVSTQTNASAGTPIPLPLMISGQTGANASVYLVGDSVMYGYTDTDTSWGYQRGSFAAAMEDTQTPYLRAAQTGSQALQFLPANSPLRTALASRCSAAVCNLGVNDITLCSGVAATVEANLVALWTSLDSQGLRVYQTTIMPSTTSSDSWATKANQTVNSTFNTCRQAVNAWLRAGATTTINGLSVSIGNPMHPLTGLIDYSLYGEDPTDSSRWLTNGSANYYTSDGIHPSPAAYAALENQITPAVMHLVAPGSPWPANAASVGAIDQLYFPYLSSIGTAQEGYIFGDVMSSCRRSEAGGSLAMISGTQTYGAWIGTPGRTETFSTLKVYLAGTNCTAATVALYVGPNQASLVQVATGTVSAPGTAGEKDVTLSNTVTVQAGQYICAMIQMACSSVTGNLLSTSTRGNVPATYSWVAGFKLTTPGNLPTGTVNIGSIPTTFTGINMIPWFAIS